jgi:hypothetical protein
MNGCSTNYMERKSAFPKRDERSATQEGAATQRGGRGVARRAHRRRAGARAAQ